MAGEPKTYTQEEVDALIAQNESGLKANRDEAVKEAKRAKDALKAYDGVDPEEFKRLKSAAEEAERKKLTEQGNFDALKKQLVDQHAKELEGRDGRIGSLTKSLERHLIDAEASRVIAELKGSVKGLLPHVKPHIRVVEVDGEFVAQVVDSKGNPRIGDAKGGPMTISQLVEEMKSDGELSRLFEGSGSSGGGASKSGAGGGGSKVVAAGDAVAFGQNLEGIAKGTVDVR